MNISMIVQHCLEAGCLVAHMPAGHREEPGHAQFTALHSSDISNLSLNNAVASSCV
jgi:hypothetical protein